MNLDHTSDPSMGASRPSRTTCVLLALALVIGWGTIRLVLFDGTMLPLTYAIPLLACVWMRDRAVLWAMAASFALLHTAKVFWILPDGVLTNAGLWTNYGATLVNIGVAAAVVDAILRLRERLETALRQVRAQAEELGAQSEELAQQNQELSEQAEELSQQTEELSKQGEELAAQNEELQSQTEEITLLNDALARRERLLQGLLETTRVSGTERSALQQITGAALDLLHPAAAASAVFGRAGDRLTVLARSGEGTAPVADGERSADAFVRTVLQENRAVSLNDASLRPDLPLMPDETAPAFGAALCAPVHLGGEPFGAFAIYSGGPHEWTDEEFRLVEWLAMQCGRVLQTLRVQSELREADHRKSEFLATLSHELRNPLAPMGFALKLLEEGSDAPRSPLQVLRRQFRQLVRLVDDLLDVTRLSRNKVQVRKTPTDLTTVVRDALAATRPDIEAAGHGVVVTLPPQPVWIEADADRLGQVLTNLLNNATRYTPQGGRLTIRVESAGDEAVLSVSDTGVGLDRRDLDRVFEIFTQVGGPGSGGLGIGLALVRGIVELHGGRVEARSEGRGRGSEFRVVLPMMAAAPMEPEPSRDSGLPRPPGCRVLVVDDNVDSAEMLALVLQTQGYSATIAHSAEDALQLVREFVPDAALLDIGLPGLNGYELARRLREHVPTRHTRLVALTGWGQQEDRARAYEAGFDAHLTKPAEPDAILAALADVRVL